MCTIKNNVHLLFINYTYSHEKSILQSRQECSSHFVELLSYQKGLVVTSWLGRGGSRAAATEFYLQWQEEDVEPLWEDCLWSKWGWTDVVESQDIWAGEHRYLQVPLPDFTREEMLAQETSKPAECHIASKWQSQSLNQRLLDSCSGSHASGPAGCRAGCPAVSKWCFLSWSLGS